MVHRQIDGLVRADAKRLPDMLKNQRGFTRSLGTLDADQPIVPVNLPIQRTAKRQGRFAEKAL